MDSLCKRSHFMTQSHSLRSQIKIILKALFGESKTKVTYLARDTDLLWPNVDSAQIKSII